MIQETYSVTVPESLADTLVEVGGIEELLLYSANN